MHDDDTMTTPDVPARSFCRINTFSIVVNIKFSSRFKPNSIIGNNQKRREAIIRESIARFNSKHQQSVQNRRCSIALATSIFNEVYDRIGDGGNLPQHLLAK